jgi:hypothetical protein
LEARVLGNLTDAGPSAPRDGSYLQAASLWSTLLANLWSLHWPGWGMPSTVPCADSSSREVVRVDLLEPLRPPAAEKCQSPGTRRLRRAHFCGYEGITAPVSCFVGVQAGI